MKQLLTLFAGCFFFGCALTPEGVLWGTDVVAQGEDIKSQVEAIAAEKGWGQLSAETVQAVVNEVVSKRVASGMTEEEAQTMPLGWRELIEALVGGGFLMNWLRNQKYNITRQPKAGSSA